jgi:hypothetical protein
MIRSLGLIAVIVAVTLIFVPGLVHPSKKDKVQALDYSNYLEGFKSLTNLTPLAPTPVPAGWRANSAALSGPPQAEHMRIGFVTPDEKYVGLVQSIGTPAVVIRTLLGKSAVTPTDHVAIAGASWDRRLSSQHEVAFTHVFAPINRSQASGVITVIVTGSATPPQLEALAAALK